MSDFTEEFDQPALTTDVIVGFPGETETEYATTVDFLTRVGLYETHIFKYSRRQGTKAAVMPDQIPEPVKGVRSDRLIALGEENRKRFEQSWIGKRAEVLFEEQTMIDGEDLFCRLHKGIHPCGNPGGSGLCKPGAVRGILKTGDRTEEHLCFCCSLYEHLPVRTDEIHQGVAGVFGSMAKFRFRIEPVERMKKVMIYALKVQTV